MVRNPNHGKDGKFSSGKGGSDTGSGNNAGKGNRGVARHIVKQHEVGGFTISPVTDTIPTGSKLIY